MTNPVPLLWTPTPRCALYRDTLFAVVTLYDDAVALSAGGRSEDAFPDAERFFDHRSWGRCAVVPLEALTFIREVTASVIYPGGYPAVLVGREHDGRARVLFTDREPPEGTPGLSRAGRFELYGIIDADDLTDLRYEVVDMDPRDQGRVLRRLVVEDPRAYLPDPTPYLPEGWTP